MSIFFPTIRSGTYHKVRLPPSAIHVLRSSRQLEPCRILPCRRLLHVGKGIRPVQPSIDVELQPGSTDGPNGVLKRLPPHMAPRDSRPSAFQDVGKGWGPPTMRVEVLSEEARARANKEVIAELLQDGSITYGPRGTPLLMEHSWLRDMCSCDLCVNVSSRQKNFQTSDIPLDVKAKSVKVLPDESMEITWTNDVPGWGADHASVYPREYLERNADAKATAKDLFKHDLDVLWDGAKMTEDVVFMDYDDYMRTDAGLCQALNHLRAYGLVFIRGVPGNPEAVEKLGERVGNLRDTFYGRTWDVKSVPQAKNVAYTHQYLGMHMDLLYMANPPGFQLLHCLQNSCEGGSSLFSDGFNAAKSLQKHSPTQFAKLTESTLAYHYRNAGEHYHYEHKVIEMKPSSGRAPSLDGPIDFLNWSPPFQAPQYRRIGARFPDLHKAVVKLGEEIEKESSVFEYRLKEGECVIFNNRRVLHARRAFDVTSGHRWLKGAYVDTDAFMSRLRVMNHKLGRYPETPEDLLANFPDYAPRSEQASHKKDGERSED